MGTLCSEMAAAEISAAKVLRIAYLPHTMATGSTCKKSWTKKTLARLSRPMAYVAPRPFHDNFIMLML